MGRYSTRFTGFFISCLLLAGCSGGGDPSSIAPTAPIPPMPLGRPDSRIVGFAYVPNAFGNNISAYTIKANGSLSPVGAPVGTGSVPWGAVVDPKGKFVYVTNHGTGNVSAYAINTASGALTQVQGSPFAAGANPTSVAIDPTGNFAYVGDIGNGSSGNVSAFAINAGSGALTPVQGSPFLAGRHPFDVTVR